MTCGSGTKGIPKDYKFENLLRKIFPSETFDKIIYYDTCIIANSGKSYGKIIITDECIYSYVENRKLVSVLSEYKNIISMDLLDDLPQFIFGPMRDDCVHIRLVFTNKSSLVKSVKKVSEKTIQSQTLCCRISVKDQNTQSSKISLQDDNNSNTKLENNSQTYDNKTQKLTNNTLSINEELLFVDSVHIYILNKDSPVMALLNKAYTNFLISQTCQISSINNDNHMRNFDLSNNMINHSFDGLIYDIKRTINNIPNHRKFLLELIRSGQKCTRIKIIFWSKPNLFDFFVQQFIERLRILLSIDDSKRLQELQSSKTIKQLINTCLNCLNLLMQVFIVFLFQTDHFYSKWQRIRNNESKLSKQLLENVMLLINYLNRHDHDDTPQIEMSDIEISIDETKYDITINAVQVFYYLICSAQTPFSNDEIDSFNIHTIVRLIESFMSWDSNEAVFNSFVNHIMRMIFIWLFPEVHKINDPNKPLDSQQILTIFQFFSSLRTIICCIPKVIKILRTEMEEEFHHFVIRDLAFFENYPLSQSAFKLIKTFQNNMLHSNNVFVD